MDALTPDGPLFRTTWFLMRVSRPIRYPCLLCRTFHPFCLQSPYAVPVRIWIFCTGLTVEILCRRNRVLADQAYQASPFSGRLATATGRIEFVNLRTGRSPWVAPTPPHGDAVTSGYEKPDIPRRGLAPRRYDNITGAPEPALQAERLAFGNASVPKDRFRSEKSRNFKTCASGWHDNVSIHPLEASQLSFARRNQIAIRTQSRQQPR